MVKKEPTAETSKEVTGEQEQVVNPEEQVKTLEAKLTEKERQLSESDQKVTKQAEELRQKEASRQDWQSEIQSLRTEMTQNMQLAVALAAEGRAPEEAEGLTPAAKGDYLQKAQALIAQNETKRIGEGYRKKVESFGLTPKDKAYREIKSYIREGDYELADGVIAELEAERQKASEKPEELKETEVEKEAKVREDERRKMMEERGELVSETGSPSAGGGLGVRTQADLERRIAQPDGIEWLKKHEKELDELAKEGKLK